MQSYISHYSLKRWMAKSEQSTPSGNPLTAYGMHERLRLVQAIADARAWSPAVNDAYRRAFDVDVAAEALAADTPVDMERAWREEHRLVCSWDYACDWDCRPPPPP
jgi:hypothetical protein